MSLRREVRESVSVDRFMRSVPHGLSPDECWEWEGARDNKNYGQVSVTINGRQSRTGAHRISAQLLGGLDIDGVLVRHKCDNPPCVNPNHLETGDYADNAMDSVVRGRNHNRNVTHCPEGHEYTRENTYMTPAGRRKCRTCTRETWRRFYYRRKSRQEGEK